MESQDAACGACKNLNRRCSEDCVYAPYFPADDPEKFSNVMGYLGKSSLDRLLTEIDANKRQCIIDRADQAFTLQQLSKPFHQATTYLQRAIRKALDQPTDERQLAIDSSEGVYIMRQLFGQVQKALEYAENAKLRSSNDLEHIHAEHVSTVRQILLQVQEPLECVEKDNLHILNNLEMATQVRNIGVSFSRMVPHRCKQSSTVVLSALEEDNNSRAEAKRQEEGGKKRRRN